MDALLSSTGGPVSIITKIGLFYKKSLKNWLFFSIKLAMLVKKSNFKLLNYNFKKINNFFIIFFLNAKIKRIFSPNLIMSLIKISSKKLKQAYNTIIEFFNNYAPKINAKELSFYALIFFLTIIVGVISIKKYSDFKNIKHNTFYEKLNVNKEYLNVKKLLADKIRSPYINIQHKLKKGETLSSILKNRGFNQVFFGIYVPILPLAPVKIILEFSKFEFP